MLRVFHYDKRNLRDIGGYRTSGGRVRTGQLFRSAHLDDLEVSEMQLLKRLGIGCAVDLRGDIEKAHKKNRIEAVLPNISCIDFCLSDAVCQAAMPTIVTELANMNSAVEARTWMCAQYADTVIRRRQDVLDCLKFLMMVSRPAIFFCVAGKDRTGVIAALLLLTLGVSRRDIMRDYALTNKPILGMPFWHKKDRSAKAQYGLVNVRQSVIDMLSDACPAFLMSALQAVDDIGGIAAYLDGIDTDLVEDFRKRLIE